MLFASNLTKTDVPPLHFGLFADVESELVKLKEKGYLVSEISARVIRKEEDLFEALKRDFSVPYISIPNWDAFEEILNDLSWIPRRGYVLVIRHSRILWLQNYDIASMFVSIWLSVSRYWMIRGIPFHLIFIED